MPMTTDLAAAQLWVIDHCAAGIEGVVAEWLGQACRLGGRTGRTVAHLNDSGGRRGPAWSSWVAWAWWVI